MSSKLTLGQIDALYNVDEFEATLEKFAEMSAEDKAQMFSLLKTAVSLAEKLQMSGYDGDLQECFEQFEDDIENYDDYADEEDE